MGFFKKLLKTAVLTGTAVGGAMYIKNRKDEKNLNDSVFEDYDDSRAFDVQKDSSSDGTTKITLTINKTKVKNIADAAADKVIETSEKIKDTVTEKVGEEKMDDLKEKMEVAKDKVSEIADIAKDKIVDTKDIVVDKIGEDKIDAAKDKIAEAANMAKDKVTETINKVTNSSDDVNDFDDDLFEEGVETEDDVTVEYTDDESNNIDEEDSIDPEDDFLEDELNDL